MDDVAILYSELAAPSEPDDASRMLRAHHRLLSEAAAAQGGDEVKWLGDGLLVAFPSAADALECALAVVRAATKPVDGDHLQVRMGVNSCEPLAEEAAYFRLPVVVAQRLCARAEPGQVLCTDGVARSLARRFAFDGIGALQLPGVPEPVPAYALRPGWPGLPARVDLVGREGELRRLLDRWTAAAAGRGGVVLVAGETGIGKTRLAAELADRVAGEGGEAWWGHCFESDWVPPYAPFVEILEALARTVDAVDLGADLGPSGAALAAVVPGLRTLLGGLVAPAPLQPDEEHFRLVDTAAQLLAARSRRTPVLVCLDDLQWADRGTIDMTRRLARLAVRHRLLVVGTLADDEIDRTRPLGRAVAGLRQEAGPDVVELKGFSVDGVGRLLAALLDEQLPAEVAAAVAAETAGNPLFVLELVRDLAEEGKISRGPDGRWVWTPPAADLRLPRSAREVIAHRLSRVSPDAKALLAAASAFEGPFPLEVAGRLAGLSDEAALDAVDEALAARLLEPADGVDVYAFVHRPVRRTVYGDLSPSRRVRLHRRLAETLAEAAGSPPSPALAADIAGQYQRSAGLPGAERGADFALVAAGHAESTGAHEDAARFLRTAVDLLPESDERRPRVLGRLGVALAWAATFEEGVEGAPESGAAITTTEGEAVAVDYVSEVIASCLADRNRLAAVQATGLLDAPPRPELDEVTTEAATRLGAPLALITLVDDHRQFFASVHGLPLEVGEQLTPLELSYCKFVAALDEPFRVNNSFTHALVRHNPIAQMARAYLGVPLRTSDGQTIGSLCVVDSSPRQWDSDDQRVLEELARQVMAMTESPTHPQVST